MKKANNLCLQMRRRTVKKCILAALIVFAVIFAVLVSGAVLLSLFDRLTLIRLTTDSNLPEWLKAFLWGWY